MDALRSSGGPSAVKPSRPKWVTHVAIGAAAIVGCFAFAISYSFVSNAMGSRQKPDQDSPKAATATIAEGSRPDPSVDSSPALSGTAAHQEAIDSLIRAYNDIADGYAQIGDAISIARGEERITRGVEQLKAAAQRGTGTPAAPGRRAGEPGRRKRPCLDPGRRPRRPADPAAQGDARHQIGFRPADRRLHQDPPGDRPGDESAGRPVARAEHSSTAFASPLPARSPPSRGRFRGGREDGDVSFLGCLPSHRTPSS